MMSNRRIIFLAVFAGALFLAVLWWWNSPTPFKPSAPKTIAGNSSPIQTNSQSLASTTNQNTSGSYSWQGDTYAPLPADRKPGYDPSLPQWAEWRRRRKADSNFEWKMPINFWGKVVDQNDQPVRGAKIRFQWTDLSPSGTTEKFTESDGQGLFSLINEKGKNMGVYLSKSKYHVVDKGRASFEYAAFFEPHYHEPDSKKPVIFRLVKKQANEPLVRTEQEVKLPQIGSVATVELDASTTIEIKLLANEINPDQPWSVQLTTSGGGLQATMDEFPVEAPAGGYQSSTIVDRKSPRQPNWSGLHQGGMFYVKTASGYGRLELRMITGKDWARVTTYVNPSGSRNLESDLTSP